MPLYDFTCGAGHRFERHVPLARFDDPQSCDCGSSARRMICAPRVKSDYIDPCLGPDGRMHDSLASYRRSLRADGNPQGETYHEIGNEELRPVKHEFDRKQRRDDIRAGLEDVKNGRVPTLTVLED